MPDIITAGDLTRAVWKRDKFKLRLNIPDHIMLSKTPVFDPNLVLPDELDLNQYLSHYIVPHLPDPNLLPFVSAN
jgi:hypothetical protein